MAVVMLSYMLEMYSNTALNIAILVGAVAAFALSLWLFRSQATVSGTSYMRAMIPHHSIAIMTSARAQIRDPRVRKLADEIIEAQRREIAKMRFLIADTLSGKAVESIYHDPQAEPGIVEDAIANTLVATLDLAPMPKAEAESVLDAASRCTFNRSPETHPVFWAARESGKAAVKLNGVLVTLDAAGDSQSGTAKFSAPGTTITLRKLGDEADWRSDAELVFKLDQGPTVGYHGFYKCGA